jgi:hypothetical protein
VQVVRGNEEIAREGAILLGPDRATLEAEVGTTTAALIAATTDVEIGLRGDRLPDLPALDSRTDFDDPASQLVPQGDGRFIGEFIEVDVQVRAAYSCRGHLNDDLAGTSHRFRRLLEKDISNSSADFANGKHGDSSIGLDNLRQDIPPAKGTPIGEQYFPVTGTLRFQLADDIRI